MIIFKIIHTLLLFFLIYFVIRRIKQTTELVRINKRNREWHEFVSESIEDNKTISNIDKRKEYLSYVTEKLLSHSYEDTVSKSEKIDEYKRDVFLKFGSYSQSIHDKYIVNSREDKLKKLLK